MSNRDGSLVFQFAVTCYCQLRQMFKMLCIYLSKHYEEQRLVSLIIKDCHSIEKGLALKSPRRGFGHKRIKQLLKRVHFYIESGYDINHLSIRMAVDVLFAYVNYHKTLGDNTDLVGEIRAIDALIKRQDHEQFGGYVIKDQTPLNKSDIEVFRGIVNTRHSIRDYSDEEVTLEEISDAVELALRAPSACNRQPSRVYIIGKTKRVIFDDYLEGTGGFSDCVNKYILITVDIGAFSFEEVNQWIVNAGIFIGYLTLTLHANNIGACIIQRTLYDNKKNRYIANQLGIPHNEQIICAIGIGKYKEKFKVPVSKRYPVNSIITIIK